MSLTFIGLSKDVKGSQIRTAGFWNIAVAIQRLTEELEFSRKESGKAASLLTAELSESRRSEIFICTEIRRDRDRQASRD